MGKFVSKLAGALLAITSAILLLTGLVKLFADLTADSIDPVSLVLTAAICALGVGGYLLAKRLFDNPDSEPPPKQKIKSEGSPATSFMLQFVGGVAGFFALVILIVYVGVKLDLGKPEIQAPNDVANSQAGADADVIGAWSYIQLFVKEQLDVPSSADFPFAGHRAVKALGGDRYSVESYVEAQNVFGAQVKTNFTATVKRVPSGWALESLEFDR